MRTIDDILEHVARRRADSQRRQATSKRYDSRERAKGAYRAYMNMERLLRVLCGRK